MFLLAAPLAGLLASASPVVNSVIPTGTYSDMRSDDTGVFGLEITIIRGGDRYFALVQCAGPALGIPELVPLRVEDKRIYFELSGAEDGCGFPSFSGKVEGDTLKGLFSVSSKLHYLKRVAVPRGGT